MIKRDLLLAAAEMFDVHPRDITGPSRFGFLLPVRFALYKALSLRGWSKTDIGRFVGGRDHSTVCHGVKRAEYLMERDPDFARAVQTLAATPTRQLTPDGETADD